jgi:hypothetical protein
VRCARSTGTPAPSKHGIYESAFCAQAIAKHRLSVEEANELALSALQEEQTRDRASVEVGAPVCDALAGVRTTPHADARPLSVARAADAEQLLVSDVEDELRYSHSRRMFELGASAARVWPSQQAATQRVAADSWQEAPERWTDAHAYGEAAPVQHATWPAEEYAPHVWAAGDAGQDAWDTGAAPAPGWGPAPPAAWLQPPQGDANFGAAHCGRWDAGWSAPPPIALAPIPPGWSGRAAPRAAAASAAAARPADADAVAQLFAAAATLLDRGTHAQAPAGRQAAPTQTHPGGGVPAPERPAAGGTAADVQRAEAAADDARSVQAFPAGSVSAAASLRTFDDWRAAPAPAFHELSDDSSDASTSSDADAMDALRDAPAGHDGWQHHEAAPSLPGAPLSVRPCVLVSVADASPATLLTPHWLYQPTVQN